MDERKEKIISALQSVAVCAAFAAAYFGALAYVAIKTPH